MTRPGLAVATLAGVVMFVAACSKSKPPESPAPPPAVSHTNSATPSSEWKPPVFQAPASTNLPSASASNAASSSPPVTPEQFQQIAALEKNYRTASAFDDRFDALLEIGQAGTAEAVKTLERLFRTEPDSALREELVNALTVVGGCPDEKLAFLRLGLSAGQPLAVRTAALDGLVDLEDPRALPLLKELLKDPNEEIRAAAKTACELVEAMVRSR